jgi:acetyltransferase-like isoleucine patch superfamily enzyme
LQNKKGILMKKNLSKVFNRLKYKFNIFFQPQMISGYKRHDGVFLKETRISNTTYIGNPEKLQIEDNVYVGHFNVIDASCGITISEGCQITNFVSIITHSSHISIRLYGKRYSDFSERKGYKTGKVFIGKYSFIGPHSLLMPNTIIGKGCIICAYSYVKGEFPDFSIIAGNPAKVVGDTREIDKEFLELNCELQEFYDEWAKDIGDL